MQPSQAALGIISSDLYVLEEAIQHQAFPMQVWNGLRVAVWQGKKFIFWGKIDEHKKLPRFSKKVVTDFLVAEENAVSTLQPLLDRFDFDTLIIGASNQRTLAERLQELAIQHGLCSHSLLQHGALTISW